jgi:hypothetical protein
MRGGQLSVALLLTIGEVQASIHYDVVLSMDSKIREVDRN